MLSNRIKTLMEEQYCLGCRSESAQHSEHQDMKHEDKTGYTQPVAQSSRGSLYTELVEQCGLAMVLSIKVTEAKISSKISAVQKARISYSVH